MLFTAVRDHSHGRPGNFGFFHALSTPSNILCCSARSLFDISSGIPFHGFFSFPPVECKVFGWGAATSLGIGTKTEILNGEGSPMFAVAKVRYCGNGAIYLTGTLTFAVQKNNLNILFCAGTDSLFFCC